MLDPTRVARTGQIPAITWKTPQGIDEMGVIAMLDGVLFVKRDEEGRLGRLFIPYIYTAARFGGRRAWFCCPGCGQKCRLLYGTHSLRCRKCRRLRYQSQYEAPAFRLLNRACKLRKRLGKSGASGDPLPPKPPRMRWRTYWQLGLLVLRLEKVGWAAMSAHVNGVRRRIR
jgi:hypothetical protein